MKYLILLLMCISPIWLNAGVSEEMNPEIINNSSSTSLQTNEITITFHRSALKCYEITLTAQYPMKSSVNIFRLQYSYFTGGSVLNSECAFFTLMKGESKASVTIDRSSDAYFTIMESPLMVENPPASDYGYNFIYRFEFR